MAAPSPTAVAAIGRELFAAVKLGDPSGTANAIVALERCVRVQCARHRRVPPTHAPSAACRPPPRKSENVLLDDVRDEFLSTALHWAALKGHGAIATLLIDHHQTANIQYVAFSLACDAGEASTC